MSGRDSRGHPELAMKYIRYFIYFVFYSALVVGGLWLYGLIKGTGFPHLNSLSRPVITMAVLALLPLIRALNRKKATLPPKVEGLESNALSLECRYRGSIAQPPAELRAVMKSICESLLFPDRYLAQSFEDETGIEYQTMPLDGEMGARKSRKNRIPLSTVTIEIEVGDRGSILRILSKSENLFTTMDNDANEEHVSAIVGALLERGLLGDPRIA